MISSQTREAEDDFGYLVRHGLEGEVVSARGSLCTDELVSAQVIVALGDLSPSQGAFWTASLSLQDMCEGRLFRWHHSLSSRAVGLWSLGACKLQESRQASGCSARVRSVVSLFYRGGQKEFAVRVQINPTRIHIMLKLQTYFCTPTPALHAQYSLAVILVS